MSEVMIRPRVKTIPATLNRFTAVPLQTAAKRNVAAYARVSTDDDEQQTSYETQIRYYTQYIQDHDGWNFVKVYTDEGITGTSTKHRKGFKEMIEAAKNGKIDLILTKSVSRFARNTLDTLSTVRELKEIGVEVYFEKENIYTLDSKGELLITIMSSLAQEESRSISENVTWGLRKRFADGKVSFPYGRFLGYCKGPDGTPEIVPEQAEIVRDIYRWFMEGKSTASIARELTAIGIPSPGGKQTWRAQTVKSILKNEKYKGDALLQKSFCTDFLTKRQKKNEGEVQQYYVDHSHPAIIEPKLWDAVQDEIHKRSASSHRNVTPYAFSGKIFCGECGGMYGSKTWNGRRTWKCNQKHLGITQCITIALREKIIEDAFVIAFNNAMKDRDDVISICEDVLRERCDTGMLQAELDLLYADLQCVTELLDQAIYTNARVAQDQNEYHVLEEQYEKRISDLRTAISDKETKIAENNAKITAIKQYIDTMKGNGIIRTFDKQLWSNTVERLIINTDGTMRFEFHGGIIYEV